MARFQFNQHSICARIGAHVAVSQRTLRALKLQEDSDAVQGPGWFDSSWELVCGLEVREGPPEHRSLGQAVAFGAFDFAAAAATDAATDAAPNDPFGEFRIDGLELR
jgi:hypothetical protein